MFLINCPTCQSQHLVGYGAVRSFENSEHGPLMTFECPNGHEALWAARPEELAATQAA